LRQKEKFREKRKGRAEERYETKAEKKKTGMKNT
jgi:hypothetical protein